MANETTTQIVREAEPIEAAKLELMRNAAQLQMPTLPAYEVAGYTPEQIQAIRYGVQGIGAYQPWLSSGASAVTSGLGTAGQAAEILRNAGAPINRVGQLAESAGEGKELLGMGVQGLQQARGMYDPAMAQRFMNPYQQQVIDESIRQINRQGDISRQNLQAQAVKAGAFGGSREGIQRAELERALTEQRNNAITGALYQGYGQAQQQAQQAFENQQARQGSASAQIAGIAPLYANLAGQQAGIYGQQFGMGSQIAQGLGSLGTQMGNLGMQMGALGQAGQQMGQQDTSFLFNLGADQQRQQQAALDAYRATAMQTAMQPFQRYSWISDIYKGAPSSQMSMMSQASPTPSPFQQIAGLGIGALGAAGAASKSGLI